VIWNAGGLDESRLEGPLFALGLLVIVVAFLALGVSLAPGRGLAWKVLAGVVGAAVGVVFTLVVESVVGGAVPDGAGWVQEEAGLWAAALLALALTLLRARRLRSD
jgi:lipopolysaccharide export LptBFGC system permease protein LptF